MENSVSLNFKHIYSIYLLCDTYLFRKTNRFLGPQEPPYSDVTLLNINFAILLKWCDNW